MRAAVLETLDLIRPALQADGGDIRMLDLKEETGVLDVELLGSCVGCPMSTMTLKAGVERILKDRVDGLTEVRALGIDFGDGVDEVPAVGADGGAALEANVSFTPRAS
ncbi:MAG: NifU-like domain protein [uncultured Acidimicrobiales bacterium]|uniref:NifU-like domain protein n=1 Tax=uncultured Acidimicrobiales bacterium TaxID=310071 RepID=A0A6J4HJ49_9ACTN|nr:MAG: NifU-like domain protein [uncultured Acidimicrobiales bacterium]